MLPVFVLLALIVVVTVLSWRRRGRAARITCCNTGAWPPDDITDRQVADEQAGSHSSIT